MNEFEFGKDREEKINKFLDNLAWYFSTKSMQDLTARAVTNLTEKIEILDSTIRKADESSTKLAKALNRLTVWGVIIAAVSVFIAALNFVFEYLIKK